MNLHLRLSTKRPLNDRASGSQTHDQGLVLRRGQNWSTTWLRSWPAVGTLDGSVLQELAHSYKNWLESRGEI